MEFEELIKRPIIRNDKPEEFLNKMTKMNEKSNSTETAIDANRVLASEAIEKANEKITFGIKDWQIKRIEEERDVDMIYSTHFWNKLGKEFAWHPFTLALYYFQYLEECRSL